MEESTMPDPAVTQSKNRHTTILLAKSRQESGRTADGSRELTRQNLKPKNTPPKNGLPKSTARRSTVVQPAGYTSADIRSFRVELGLSQSLFADLLGVSKSLVEHWERGVRPPSATVRRLLDAIRARPDSFMSQVHIDQPLSRRDA
jgi:putative transcriptional regulator